MDPSQLPKLDRFSMHVTVYFKPEDLPTFWSTFKPVFDACKTEKELLYFEVFEDPTEPGKMTWIENWEGSPQWFFGERFPQRMDIYKPYLDATEPLFVKPREASFYKRVGAPYVFQRPENLK